MDAFNVLPSDPVLLVRGAVTELGIRPFDVAEQLADAAHSKASGVFDVTAAEILQKLRAAKSLAFAVHERRVVAFMALHPGIALSRTGLTVAYVQGVIVHARQRGQNLPFELLKTALGPHGWPDLVALHTQTPAMARCIEGWSRGVCFPRAMGPYALQTELVDDLREGMDSIQRSVGEPGTGICRNAYEHRLFHGEEGHLPHLGERDALFMLAFTSQASRRGLRPLERVA